MHKYTKDEERARKALSEAKKNNPLLNAVSGASYHTNMLGQEIKVLNRTIEELSYKIDELNNNIDNLLNE